jgi:predicted DsbA family dithiol-disulfide isomerase
LSVPAGPQKNLLISRLYQAYFNESLDLSRSEVLVEIAHGFGFSKVWTLQALARGNPKRLEDFRNEAKAHAFPGLPGFLYAGKKHFGALPQKTWDAILKTPKGAVHV